MQELGNMVLTSQTTIDTINHIRISGIQSVAHIVKDYALRSEVSPHGIFKGLDMATKHTNAHAKLSK